MLFHFKGKSNKIRSQFYEFPIAIVVCCVVRTSGLFLESPDNFSATKILFRVCIQDQGFNNFERCNKTIS